MTIAAELEALASPHFGGVLPVRLRAWDGSVAGPDGAPTVVVRSPGALRRLLSHPGELGAAQAYVTGELDVDGDLLDGLRRVRHAVRAGGARRIGVRDLPAAWRAARRLGVPVRPLPAPASQARLHGRLHSPRRDRRAVAHHYDLSNELYGLILDPQMAYSCAYWRSIDPGYTVADAQRDKLELVCCKLGLRPGMRLLDVGCGWGSLSMHAAEHHGARVVAITLSRRQRGFVAERVAGRCLDGPVTVRLQDYRDVDDGPFDAIGSIEMGEHVGERNYPSFLARLRELLRPEGRLLIQQMARRDRPGGGPFIEAFIAPDMHMRPVGATVAMIEDAGLEVRDVQAMREHYVRTVHAWYETFEARLDEVVALVGEEVARVWRLYLVGGALAFEEGRMGVDQILAVRPGAAGRSGMPTVLAAR